MGDTETMRAGRLNFRTGTFAVLDVARPAPGPGQVLVRVRAAGICLSDVHLITGAVAPVVEAVDEITLGHEVAGDVVDVGLGVSLEWVGRRVALQANEEVDGRLQTRGVDYDGGWAEYTVAAVTALAVVPDEMTFEQACIVPDAVSTPWAAVMRTAGVRAGEAVGVWGVGGLGAHAIQILRMIGAAPVVAVDPVPAARERAKDLGADLVLAPSDDVARHVDEVTTGAGLTYAFDFAGVAAVRDQAVGCLARGGGLVLVGLSDQPLTIQGGLQLSYFGQRLLGHYGAEPEDLGQLLALVRQGRLDLSASITEVLALEDVGRGVEQLEHGLGSPVRLVVRP